MYIANYLHARVYWSFEGGASFADLQLLVELNARAKGCNMLNCGNFGHFTRKPDLVRTTDQSDQRLCYSLSIK